MLTHHNQHTWQLVPAHKVARNVAVLVGLLLVPALDDNVLIGGFDGDLIGRELLDVQNNLVNERTK